MGKDLGLDSSINCINNTIHLRQLFKLQDKSIYIDVPLAKQFFHGMAKKRIAALSTHLIGEILADINEYKWLSQNPGSKDLLNSSSSFPDSPTKLDLTVKDWDFLYLHSLESLIKLPPALETDLTNHFKIKNEECIDNLRIAISNLHHIFLTEYINHYQFSIKRNSNSVSPILNLSKLQNILNKLYVKPLDSNSIPFKDSILLFVANYYDVELKQDIDQVNCALENYFYPCWLLLKKAS